MINQRNTRASRILNNKKANRTGIKVSLTEPSISELRDGDEIDALIGETLYRYKKVKGRLFKIEWSVVNG